jgi:hypothetical protein
MPPPANGMGYASGENSSNPLPPKPTEAPIQTPRPPPPRLHQGPEETDPQGTSSERLPTPLALVRRESQEGGSGDSGGGGGHGGGQVRPGPPVLTPWESLAKEVSDEYLRDGPDSLAAVRKVLQEEGSALGTRYFPQQDIRTAIAAYLARSVGLPRTPSSAPLSPAQRARWVQASIRLAVKVTRILILDKVTGSVASIMTQLSADEGRDSKAQGRTMHWIAASLAVGISGFTFTVASCLWAAFRARRVKHSLGRVARQRSQELKDRQLDNHTNAITQLGDRMYAIWHRVDRPRRGASCSHIRVPHDDPEDRSGNSIELAVRSGGRGSGGRGAIPRTPARH